MAHKGFELPLAEKRIRLSEGRAGRILDMPPRSGEGSSGIKTIDMEIRITAKKFAEYLILHWLSYY